MSVSRQNFVAGSAAAFATIGFIKPAQAAEFNYKFAVDLATDHPINVRAVEAFEKIRKVTNGRLDIKSFPNSQLGGDPAMLTQLRTGALEILAFPGAFLNSVVPVASIENLAFAFPTRETAFAAMDGDLGKVIRAEITAKDIVVLEKIWENGFREITTNVKPIKTVDDLQGLKIRVSPGKIRIDTFQSLGASPTPISISELYTALQTHIVDAEENPLLNIETQKFYEVQKFCSISNHIWSGYWTLIGKDAWNRLPKDLQTLLASELNAAAVKARRDNAVQEVSLRDKLQRRGLLFNTAETNSFKAKLASAKYYERWKAEFGPTAWSALEKYANKLG
jgi:tripartite ATP-independent transporter DctP family solute receptor